MFSFLEKFSFAFYFFIKNYFLKKIIPYSTKNKF